MIFKLILSTIGLWAGILVFAPYFLLEEKFVSSGIWVICWFLWMFGLIRMFFSDDTEVAGDYERIGYLGVPYMLAYLANFYGIGLVVLYEIFSVIIQIIDAIDRWLSY